MADAHETGYLSIGEVLGLLLEDFPDVTISKIRFLESQGLISPERTASGYRKFYEPDVELLRVILTEQRSNYLPLRVIKDRLETGEIDPTGESLRPDADESLVVDAAEDESEAAEVPPASKSRHPASRGNGSTVETAPPAGDASSGVTAPSDGPDEAEPTSAPADANPSSTPPTTSTAAPAGPGDMPGVLLDRGELCAQVGMSEAELQQLESFGIVTTPDGGIPPLYGDDAVAIATSACEFLRAGVDARHLRNWRTSAEREASLYEQLVTPRFRQRNPESRAEALNELRRLDELGGHLRAALTRQALRRHFES